MLWVPVQTCPSGCRCVSLVLAKWRRITRLETRTKEISNAASVLVENRNGFEIFLWPVKRARNEGKGCGCAAEVGRARPRHGRLHHRPILIASNGFEGFE